ncbi:MAG: T9SS type A sorting domain-containing protein [Saprospiraceae bacterium]|nr:T9SS type A sorting domain-containing protein [Saprospiraceae bacterium]
MMSSTFQVNAQGCSQPSNLTSNILSTTSARVSWSAIQGAFNYTVQYRIQGTTAWTTTSATAARSFTLTGLRVNTVYEWRVKASCSVYSSVAVFNTGGNTGGNTSCSQPSNLTSNILSTTSATVSWSAIQGALNYTVQYRIQGTTAWTTTSATAARSFTLTGLRVNTVYEWRVKASCSVYSSVAVFNTGGNTGGNTSCSQPSNLTSNVRTTTSVLLSWSGIQGAFNYTVQYRIINTTAWTTTAATTGLSLSIANLQANREYEWRVKASCSEYSSIAKFITGTTTGGGGSSSCSAPSNTNTNAVFTNRAIVSWEAQGGAANYTVQYKLENATTYITVGTTTGTVLTISGLQAGRKYVWRVKASCSPYGSDVQFETPFASGNGNASTMSGVVNVSPNPALGNEVQIGLETEGAQIMLFDATGRLIKQEVSRDMQHTLNVANLPNGMYFIRVSYADSAEQAQTTRLVIAH